MSFSRVRRVLVGVLFLALCLAPAAFAEKNKFEQEVDKEQAVLKFLREHAAPSDPEEGKLAQDLAEQVFKGGYKILSVAELQRMIAEKKPLVLVDSMPMEAFKAEHIPGAKQFLFPIPDMNEWNATETAGQSADDYAALLGPDKDKPVIVYCGFVKCTRSHNGALWARKLGYRNVYRVPGGIFAWKGAGYPVEVAK